MASSYSPMTSKVPLLAKNFALQIQNLANFSASGILDKMVNTSLESTPYKEHPEKIITISPLLTSATVLWGRDAEISPISNYL